MPAPLNVLVTGSGRSGSWQIRGAQLGAAIGATVHPHARDVAGFHAAVLIKRPPLDLIALLERSHVPVVYDIVDAWPQPRGNDWDATECKAWLADRLTMMVQPHAIVAATNAMARDCSEIVTVPTLTLPHHARVGMERNPIRDKVAKVGYEGGENYIGRWRPVLESECARRGWQFVVNPRALADIDIVVGLRAQTGYACRHWKSNVKLANAQGSGTPCVMNREAGYLETSSGGERWADDAAELAEAFDSLTPHAARVAAAEVMFRAAPTLESVAKTYREWLQATFDA